MLDKLAPLTGDVIGQLRRVRVSGCPTVRSMGGSEHGYRTSDVLRPAVRTEHQSAYCPCRKTAVEVAHGTLDMLN